MIKPRPSVVKPDAAHQSSLHYSGPIRRRDINLIRQVGSARSSGAVKSPTDESSLNLEVTAASA